MSPATLHHYVVVRADLPHGVQAAQIVHAAGESSPGKLPEGTFAVALHAPDEAALVRVADTLSKNGIAFVSVREDDAPYAGALMALGIVPMRKEIVRPYLSQLPLVK